MGVTHTIFNGIGIQFENVSAVCKRTSFIWTAMYAFPGLTCDGLLETELNDAGPSDDDNQILTQLFVLITEGERG